MADQKISQLTGAATPLAGTEVLPIVQSGSTKKVAVSDLTAGRAISATSVTASTGNFVVGTSGQGIDFSATPGTGTSELLSDYEEGTWTATFTGTTTAPTVPVTTTAIYTKVGRLVTININFPIPFATTGASGNVRVDGLPFTPLVPAFSAVSMAEFGTATAIAIASGTSITFNQAVDIYTPIAMTTTPFASLRLTLTFTV